jgi:hypothetical protein
MRLGAEEPADWDDLRSPEYYVGYQRTEHFASPGGVEPDRRRRDAAPSRVALNQWARNHLNLEFASAAPQPRAEIDERPAFRSAINRMIE